VESIYESDPTALRAYLEGRPGMDAAAAWVVPFVVLEGNLDVDLEAEAGSLAVCPRS